MGRLQQVVCENCGNPVWKEAREVKRSLKLGRKFFCDSSCAAQSGNGPRRAKEIKLVCPCGQEFAAMVRTTDVPYLDARTVAIDLWDDRLHCSRPQFPGDTRHGCLTWAR